MVTKKPPRSTSSYHHAVGRRKTAVAVVRLTQKGSGQITVNGRPVEQYFPIAEFQKSITSPLQAVGHASDYTITATVRGGGIRGQAEAVRHAISRTLLTIDPAWRATLKPLGVLTRDPRAKERKKPGLHRARRAPQFSKR